MKKKLYMIIVFVMVLSFAACGNVGGSTQAVNTASAVQPDETEEVSATAEPVPSAETMVSEENASVEEAETTGNKILVVYFSWSGNLDKMAHWVADETDGDLYRVTAKDPYPENYNETADRAKSEQDKRIRPEINFDLTAEQMADYETIFFGFPVWWYDLPMSMWTFLESFDFSGKTIIPFFSHEGSSNGARALPTVTDLAKGAEVMSSKALSIRGQNVAASEDTVRNWVKSLEY